MQIIVLVFFTFLRSSALVFASFRCCGVFHQWKLQQKMKIWKIIFWSKKRKKIKIHNENIFKCFTTSTFLFIQKTSFERERVSSSLFTHLDAVNVFFFLENLFFLLFFSICSILLMNLQFFFFVLRLYLFSFSSSLSSYVSVAFAYVVKMRRRWKKRIKKSWMNEKQM